MSQHQIMPRISMLKYLMFALCIIGFNSGSSFAANGAKIVNLCQIVDDDDIKALKRQIKKAGLPKKSLSISIDCSANHRFPGGNLLRLAISSGSFDVGKFLIKSTQQGLLKKPDKDGLTILEWANLYYEDNAASDAIISHLRMRIGK